MGDLTAGVDIGGTKIQAAILREGAVIGSHRHETPAAGVPELVAAIRDALGEALEDAGTTLDAVATIGIGIPGSVDGSTGTVANANNVSGLEGDEPVRLATLVSDTAGGVPVMLGNDATVATLGEWQRGAGRAFGNLMGVWVGTGVGGGLVLNGELHHGLGAAGEIGHVIVKPGGRICSDGRRGHLEAYAGRGRMEARAQRLVKEGRKTILFELMERRGRPRLTSGVIAAALEREDKLAHELIDSAVWALGVALASVQNLLALEAIVIGGGLGDRLGRPFVDRIAEQMLPQLFVPDRPPDMLTSGFGDLSGAVGAAVLAGG